MESWHEKEARGIFTVEFLECGIDSGCQVSLGGIKGVCRKAVCVRQPSSLNPSGRFRWCLCALLNNWHPLSVGFRLQSCCCRPPVAVVHFGGQISNTWQVHRRAFCWNLFSALAVLAVLTGSFFLCALFIYLPCLHCGIMGKAASNQNHVKQKYLKSILTKNNMDIST